MSESSSRPKVLVVFGTRPELIKLAPVVRELATVDSIRPVLVSSGQHADLVPPLLTLFGLRLDHDLALMSEAQSPTQFCGRLLAALEPVLSDEQPDLVLVQGDTTTALGAALAACYQRIPIGHVEAGLRSGDAYCPFPEEMNRRLIGRLAALHFAPTQRNRDTLLAEGIRHEQVVVTGNPVVDALQTVLHNHTPSPHLRQTLDATEGHKRLVLTTHRRESFGPVLESNLTVLRSFLTEHDDVALLFPVHPNPVVRQAATDILGRSSRVFLLPPLPYGDFVHLLAHAWLVVSDSGGIQEEAPSLAVDLLVLRSNTERPEVVECGCAQLVGDDPQRLGALLERAYRAGPVRIAAPGSTHSAAATAPGRSWQRCWTTWESADRPGIRFVAPHKPPRVLSRTHV